MICASRGPASAASLLERARRTEDELAARLLLAAAVQEAALGVGVRAALTGGTAADFYASSALGTSEAYPAKWRPSSDIDVVVVAIEPLAPARALVLEALERIGMRPRWSGGTARVVDVPDFPFTLEIVGEELGAGRGERPVTVLLDDEIPLTVRSPEDVILAYAESGWHLRHAGDWTRALAVFASMKDKIDFAYLHQEAARRKQSAVVERVERLEPLRTEAA